MEEEEEGRWEGGEGEEEGEGWQKDRRLEKVMNMGRIGYARDGEEGKIGLGWIW